MKIRIKDGEHRIITNNGIDITDELDFHAIKVVGDITAKDQDGHSTGLLAYFRVGFVNLEAEVAAENVTIRPVGSHLNHVEYVGNVDPADKVNVNLDWTLHEGSGIEAGEIPVHVKKADITLIDGTVEVSLDVLAYQTDLVKRALPKAKILEKATA